MALCCVASKAVWEKAHLRFGSARVESELLGSLREVFTPCAFGEFADFGSVQSEHGRGKVYYAHAVTLGAVLCNDLFDLLVEIARFCLWNRVRARGGRVFGT